MDVKKNMVNVADNAFLQAEEACWDDERWNVVRQIARRIAALRSDFPRNTEVMADHYLILDEEKLSSELRSKGVSFEQLVSNYVKDGWKPVGGSSYKWTRWVRAWNWVHFFR